MNTTGITSFDDPTSAAEEVTPVNPIPTGTPERPDSKSKLKGTEKSQLRRLSGKFSLSKSLIASRPSRCSG